jgi:hypothetical protein
MAPATKRITAELAPAHSTELLRRALGDVAGRRELQKIRTPMCLSHHASPLTEDEIIARANRSWTGGCNMCRYVTHDGFGLHSQSETSNPPQGIRRLPPTGLAVDV